MVGGPRQLCARCFGKLHFITAPFCRSCGVPFSYSALSGPTGRCAACIEHPAAFTTARAALAYDPNSRALLLAFKHADRTELAALFAPMLARAGARLLADADLLVPVPLHPSRLRRRGYNQAALLAQAVARLSSLPTHVDALRRTRRTQSLGHLGATERQAMLRGAIAPHPRHARAIAGRRILLIDDVMTSGATSNACARALLAAGASRVDALVVARVHQGE